MGGDITTPPGSDTGEDSSLDQDSSQLSSPSLSLELESSYGYQWSRNGLSMKMEDGELYYQNELVLGEFKRGGPRFSSDCSDFEINRRRRESVYRKVLLSYDELQIRSKGLEEAKRKVFSYTPGAWIGSGGATKLRDYDVPKTTTLLLVGPKGSGKSSLVNRISKVFEDDKFASERAQVTYNSSVGDGTLFLQEYMIPRCSTSFCLYDTRSLSDDSSENIKVLKHWMKNGVRHGELVIRNSDSQSLRTTMMCKARDSGYLSSEIRKVNFVIFVVNGLSVLKSIESDEDAGTRYTQMVASAFNSPYLTFKDDKPLAVVTHGDLLSPVERARVRVHLGELLGIPPKTQVFDIPEGSDPVTELAIVDMLRHSLEHAEKNLLRKRKVRSMSLFPCMLLLAILGIAINIWCMNHQAHIQHGPFPSSQEDILHCPSRQMHIQRGHGSSPQAHIQHGHGPLPEANIQHGPSPSSPPPPPLPQEHIQHDPSPPSPQAHIQRDSSPPSPRAHIQHGPPPQVDIQHGSPSPSPQAPFQHDASSQEHIYHGPLPKAELHNIRTKPQNIKTKPHQGLSPQAELDEAELDFRTEWAKIRHMWLDDRTEWAKIRHMWLDD